MLAIIYDRVLVLMPLRSAIQPRAFASSPAEEKSARRASKKCEQRWKCHIEDYIILLSNMAIERPGWMNEWIVCGERAVTMFACITPFIFTIYFLKCMKTCARLNRRPPVVVESACRVSCFKIFEPRSTSSINSQQTMKPEQKEKANTVPCTCEDKFQYFHYY